MGFAIISLALSWIFIRPFLGGCLILTLDRIEDPIKLLDWSLSCGFTRAWSSTCEGLNCPFDPNSS